MQTEDTLKIIFGLIVLLILSGFFFILGNGLFAGQEKYECQKWQSEAKAYQDYYLTQWQKDQCDHYNITIEAPVY